MKHKSTTVHDILNGPKPEVRGVMEYDQKTGGRLVIIPASAYKEHKHKTRRTTYGSNLNLNK